MANQHEKFTLAERLYIPEILRGLRLGDFDVLVVNSELESACAELVSLLVGPNSSQRGVPR